MAKKNTPKGAKPTPKEKVAKTEAITAKVIAVLPTVRIKKLDKAAKFPKYRKGLGIVLFAHRSNVYPTADGAVSMYSTDLAITIPEGYVGEIHTLPGKVLAHYTGPSLLPAGSTERLVLSFESREANAMGPLYAEGEEIAVIALRKNQEFQLK